MRRVRLLIPSLLRQPKVRLLEHDLLERFDEKLQGAVDLVRVANVLNLRRLSESGVKNIARHLGMLCREGGFIYACSSKREGSRASLFIVKNGRLLLKTNLNDGIDTEQILNNLQIPTL